MKYKSIPVFFLTFLILLPWWRYFPRFLILTDKRRQVNKLRRRKGVRYEIQNLPRNINNNLQPRNKPFISSILYKNVHLKNFQPSLVIFKDILKMLFFFEIQLYNIPVIIWTLGIILRKQEKRYRELEFYGRI